jgi:hypothetical protein
MAGNRAVNRTDSHFRFNIFSPTWRASDCLISRERFLNRGHWLLVAHQGEECLADVRSSFLEPVKCLDTEESSSASRIGVIECQSGSRPYCRFRRHFGHLPNADRIAPLPLGELKKNEISDGAMVIRGVIFFGRDSGFDDARMPSDGGGRTDGELRDMRRRMRTSGEVHYLTDLYRSSKSQPQR